jgi:hypothetical protein
VSEGLSEDHVLKILKYHLPAHVGDWLHQSINSPITFIFSPKTQKINDILAIHEIYYVKELKIV